MHTCWTCNRVLRTFGRLESHMRSHRPSINWRAILDAGWQRSATAAKGKAKSASR